MRLAVLFSGGKDSHLAMFRAMRHHEVACLVTVESRNPESYMFHVPNIHLTELQAEAIGLPLVKVESEGRKEELEDLRRALELAVERYAVEGVVTGAIRSTYQSTRVQRVCRELDLWCFNPLWLEDEYEVYRELLENGFEVIVSGVFSYPLDASLLGRRVDWGLVEELGKLKERYGVSMAGEGGELETTVLDAPFYRKRVVVLEAEKVYSNYSGVYRVKRARLEEKGGLT
ncbi:diphthine--ammonia ligase [Thermofilum pendens]|uniref:ATP binding protein n=1 Tax=Thermofilum pendens (strain DSM 2475 / Hrk 5) TaxID=368408 RepID=A1RZ76_THEPD|nr:diphthine--ammonia ligase [Thermofilum pendens]ABL78506.1 putative ATP binding protein [Thermofilum pendens Hrk 5]